MSELEMNGMTAKVYCCLPVQNWKIGRFQFKDGYLTLVKTEDQDDIAEFETMLKTLPKRVILQIRSLTDAAYGEAMKSSRFRRERARILGPEAAGMLMQSEIIVGSADEAVEKALQDEQNMQIQSQNTLDASTLVPQELPKTQTSPSENNVGGQALTQAKIALGDSPLVVDTEVKPAAVVVANPNVFSNKTSN